MNNVGLYTYNDNIYLHEYWVYTVNKLPVNKSYLLSNFLTRSDHNKLGGWKWKPPFLANFDSFYIISSEQFHKETVYDEVHGRQVWLG